MDTYRLAQPQERTFGTEEDARGSDSFLVWCFRLCDAIMYSEINTHLLIQENFNSTKYCTCVIKYLLKIKIDLF